MFLSVIIPAFNEAERLPETLVLIHDYLEQKNFEAEVVIVDDGSTDETVAFVEQAQKRFPEIRLIRNAVNKGKGGVVRQGMLEATGEYRLFTDADYSTPITEFDKFIPLLGKYDVIIGSRYLEKGSIKVKQPLKRRIISRAGNWLIQHSLLPGIIDTRCGFKLFTAKAAEEIFPVQSMTGWAFDDEVLAIAKVRGLTIKEVPVDWYDAKESKLRAVHAAKRSFQDLRVIQNNVRQGVYKSAK